MNQTTKTEVLYKQLFINIDDLDDIEKEMLMERKSSMTRKVET